MPDLGDRTPEVLRKIKRVDIIGKIALVVAIVGVIIAVIGTIVAIVALLKK